MPSDSKPELLTDYRTEEEQASALGVCARTLRNWRRDKRGPPFTLIAGRLFYYKPSTEKWLRSQEKVSA
jgi:hypothetical protein